MVRSRAEIVAKGIVSEVSKTMELEKQTVDHESKEWQIQETMQQLLNSGSSKIWSE